MKKENKNLSQEIVWLLNEKYGGRLTEKAKKDITRLKNGEPVDYVIGYKNFLGCKIDLRYKPLIPREETEYLMGKVLGFIFQDTLGCPSGQPRSCPRQNFAKANHAILPADAPEKQNPKPCLRILDIFAGSGCCGIAVLKNVPNSRCDFVDIEDNCLKQIRLNLKLNGITKKRYRVIKSDVFENIKGNACPERGFAGELSRTAKRVEGYDIILANPPYIAFNQINKVQKSVLNFEPKKALFTKDNGLYFIKKLLKQAKNYLAENGVIYLEFGYNQKKDITKLLKNFDYKNFEFQKDQFNKWRCLRIKNFKAILRQAQDDCLSNHVQKNSSE